MELICLEDENDYVILDKALKVVEYPTLYLRAINNNNLRYSKKSVSHYAKVLCYFCSYLEKTFTETNVDTAIAIIDGFGISDYLKEMQVLGLSPATIRNREVIIRALLSWLTTVEGRNTRENNGYISAKYKSPNPDKKIPKYLTFDEIIGFILLLHDESQRCLVHLMFDSGIRISEVERLKKSDIPKLEDYPENTVYFDLNVKGSKGRGGFIKERKTFITRALIQRINRLHKQHKTYKRARRKYGDDMPCFLNVNGDRITIDAIKNLLYKTAKRGNLNHSKYSSHKYRHSFAISVLLSEFDTDYINKLVITKEALGHSSIKTTEIYSNISPAAIRHLQNVNQKHDIFNRFEESQLIFDKTYLPQKNHKEKRGRR